MAKWLKNVDRNMKTKLTVLSDKTEVQPITLEGGWVGLAINPHPHRKHKQAWPGLIVNDPKIARSMADLFLSIEKKLIDAKKEEKPKTEK